MPPIPRIRPARGADRTAIEAIVAAACDPYVARIGRNSAPMETTAPR